MRSPRTATLLAVSLAALALGTAGCETNLMKREKGVAAMKSGDHATAESKFQEVVTKRPDDWRTQYYLGLNYLKQNRPLQAQVALEQALQLAPEKPQSLEGNAFLESILDNLAEAYLRQNRFDSLSAFLQKTASYYGETDDYLRQARFLARAGDVDGAKAAFQKAGAFADKTDPSPYVEAARFYEDVGDVPSAVQAYQYAYYVDWQDLSTSDARILDGLRKHGVVPGPTVASEPPKPEMFR